MAKAIKIALVKSISFLTHVSEVLSMTAVAADDDTAAAKGAVDVCFTLEVLCKVLFHGILQDSTDPREV